MPSVIPYGLVIAMLLPRFFSLPVGVSLRYDKAYKRRLNTIVHNSNYTARCVLCQVKVYVFILRTLLDKTRTFYYNGNIILKGGYHMATRVLEQNEYRQIIGLLLDGFTTHTGATFRPNRQIALAFQLQASLGLRIGDVLTLCLSNFRNGKLETTEDKTGKLQYRDVNPAVIECIYNYAIDKGIKGKEMLFTISVRAVQKQLGIITDYLSLTNIGTHSFRKMYATHVYEANGNNIELLKELLNHTSIATTQRYIRVSQAAINEASASVNFI